MKLSLRALARSALSFVVMMTLVGVGCGGATSITSDGTSGNGGTGGSNGSTISGAMTGGPTTSGAMTGGAEGGATTSTTGSTGSSATGRTNGGTTDPTDGGPFDTGSNGTTGTGARDGGAEASVDSGSGRICGNGAGVGEPCPAGEFCKFATGVCGLHDQPGQCAMEPGGWPKFYMPVCGCDGTTHQNEMEAWAHGVSVSSVGECEGPADAASDAKDQDRAALPDARSDANDVLDGSPSDSTTICGEPARCEGYDNGADARLSATVSCLSPNVVKAGAAFTLSIYGQHLAPDAASTAIVTIGSGPGAAPINGTPVSACHLTVQVPASSVTASGQAAVVVSPGGYLGSSSTVFLTVQ